MGDVDAPLRPPGTEGVVWARTPCVPPYCWHRCEPRVRADPSVDPAGAMPEATATTNGSVSEDDPRWRPTPVRCPLRQRARRDGFGAVVEPEGPLSTMVQGDPLDDAGDLGDLEGLIHPIAIGVPAGAVVGCVPRKRRSVAHAASVVDAPRGPKPPTAPNGGNGGNGGAGGAGAAGSTGLRAYEFGPTEEHAYRESYQTARFALTKRKVKHLIATLFGRVYPPSDEIMK